MSCYTLHEKFPQHYPLSFSNIFTISHFYVQVLADAVWGLALVNSLVLETGKIVCIVPPISLLAGTSTDYACSELPGSCPNIHHCGRGASLYSLQPDLLYVFA